MEVDAEFIVQLVDALNTPDESQALHRAGDRARLRLDAGRPDGAPSRNPLHWPIAFPEVFSIAAARKPGFDAMVGNPPFVGGQKITGAAGTDYRNHLVAWIASETKGSADLVAYFFLNATKISRSLGYLATNTIAQGDTSEVGLTPDRRHGMEDPPRHIVNHLARRSDLGDRQGVGDLHSWSGQHVLDGRPVAGIDEMLYPLSRSGWRKRRLVENADKSFQGSIVLGMGFTMSPEEAQALINKDSKNADVLFPYLGGEDLNQSPTQTAPRWIINFFDWPEEKARRYPDCFSIVQERIRPERDKVKDAAARFWWRYLRPRPNLYREIAPLDRVLALCQTSKVQLPVFVPTGQVLAHKLVIFSLDDYFSLGVLSSGHHWHWVLRYGSSMRNDPVYTPSDVFETFPQPPYSDAVAAAGSALDACRSTLMVDRDLGLTDVYNLIHDPSERSDERISISETCTSAWTWQYETPTDGPISILAMASMTYAAKASDSPSRPRPPTRPLDRLLELNKERYEDEVAAGLHTRAKKPKARKAQPANQGSMFGDVR